MRIGQLLLASLLAAACDGSKNPAAPTPPPSGLFTFTYRPPPGAPTITSITVPGSFNGWNTNVLQMLPQPNGTWQAQVRLPDGRFEYKFYINGAWPADMCNDVVWGDPAKNRWIDVNALGCVPDGVGGRNAVAGVGAAAGTGLGFQHDPRSAAYVSAADGRLSIRFRANPQQVQSASVRVGAQSYAMHYQLGYMLQDVWRGTIPEGTSTYSIAVQTSTGTQELGPFTAPSSLFRAVPWVGTSVGYQIFPERFANGDASNDSLTVRTDEHPFLHPSFRSAPPTLSAWTDPPTSQHCCHQYFGGDLRGIAQRLDYLQSLGVTLLYLNPIFRAGSAHGYDGWSYLEVDPAFGDEALLRELMQQADARGIRLVWDFVPNHVGVGHPAFQDAVQKGPTSAYWSWFTFRVPHTQVQVGNGNHYDSWWGIGSLPELNTRNADVMSHLMSAVRKWTEFGLDGIRVDVPGDIDNRTEFFRAFRQTAKGLNPDVYLVGEIWQRDASWLQGDEFDALMNYAIGQEVIERFATGALGAGMALHQMSRLYAEYPEASAAMQFNVISSHDASRLLTKMGGGTLGATPGAEALARQRLASAMLYALPGVPVTFQGDECAFLGASGGLDEHRYPMQWDRCDQSMVAHYQRLAALRRDLAPLGSAALRFHRGEGTVLSWHRGEPGSGEVLAVFNGSGTAATAPLPGGSWVDVVSGARASGDVALPGWGWLYLRRE